MKRLLEADNQSVKENDIFFSDFVIRVNSHEERKARILIVTNQKLYLLIQKEKVRTEFSIKTSYLLKNIPVVEIGTNSALLLNIQLNNQ